MPEPTYVNDAGTWRQQRGTSFGTDREGKDFIELIYRGATDKAFLWSVPWRAGTACPEPGFTHCKLLHPPTVREAAPGFSEARLRFEGVSQLSGSAVEGTDPTVTHHTEETEFIIRHEHDGMGEVNAVYLYNRVIVQASYVRATKPTASLRFASKLNDDPDPVPIANVDHKYSWLRNYSLLTLKDPTKNTDLFDYEVKTVGRVLNWSQTAPDVFEVTEEHVKFINGGYIKLG